MREISNAHLSRADSRRRDAGGDVATCSSSHSTAASTSSSRTRCRSPATAVRRRPVASHRAIASGRTILHEATVGAGLPVIDTLQKLLEAGDEVLVDRRVSVGNARVTCSVSSDAASAFSGRAARARRARIHRARSADRSVRTRRRAKGADPRAARSDIRGELVRRRASSRSCRFEFSKARRSRIPATRAYELDDEWASRVARRARRTGRCCATARDVTPTAIAVGLAGGARRPIRSAHLHGTDNQFTFTTLRYRERPLVITGPGAGPAVTAAGVFNDLLRLERTRARHRAPVSPRVVVQT